MLELLLSICIALIGAVIFQKRNQSRLRANKTMNHAVDDIFKAWNTLMDAKAQYDDDVPDEIASLATWMMKCARVRGLHWMLAKSLIEGRVRPLPRKSIADGMREPLQAVFHDLIHAWFIYISNRNLVARLVIRYALGRMIEKDDETSPYDAQLVQNLAKRKNNPCSDGAAAA